MKWVTGAVATGVATGAVLLVALVLLVSVSSHPPTSPGPSPPPVGTPSTAALQTATAGLPAASPRASQATIGVDIGQLAPDFALQSLDGRTIRLSDFRGHPLWVNFWASWCPPCRDEMPRLEGIYLGHAADGLVILGAPSATRQPMLHHS